MSRIIRVDEEVYSSLQKKAVAFVDTPNSVLRRILGLEDSTGDKERDPWSRILRNFSPTSDQTSGGRGSRPNQESLGRESDEHKEQVQRDAALSTIKLELPLLLSLFELGGTARAKDVIDLIARRLNGTLNPMDRERLNSGVVRWINRAYFARFLLSQKGDLDTDTPRGVWKLSDQGRKRLQPKK